MPLFRRLRTRGDQPPPVPDRNAPTSGDGNPFAAPPRGASPYVNANANYAEPHSQVTDRPGPHTLIDITPPDDRAPGPFYEIRNAATLRRATVNESWLNADEGWSTTPRVKKQQDNPYEHHDAPAPPSHSPSNFRFLSLPLGLFRSERHLNGNHHSTTVQPIPHEIGGMHAPRRFRNTYRMEPPPRDAMNGDRAAAMTVPGAEYVSPDVPPQSASRTWRLS